MRYLCFTIYFNLFIISCYAQEKLPIAYADFANWETITSSSISLDGKWIHYAVKSQDTINLYLHSIATAENIIIKGGSGPVFCPKSKWFAYYQGATLYLTNLATLQTTVVSSEVEACYFSENGAYLVVLKLKGTRIAMEVMELKSMTISFASTVTSYSMSPTRDRVSIVIPEEDTSRLEVLSFAKNITTCKVVSFTDGNISNMKWDADGKRLAFFKEKNTALHEERQLILYCSEGFDGRIQTDCLDVLQVKNFPKNGSLTTHNLHLNSNDKTVFFTIERNISDCILTENETSVQVWRADDFSLTRKRTHVDKTLVLQWYLWDIARRAVVPIEDSVHPRSIFMNTGKHALVYDPDASGSIYKNSNELLSLHIKDLKTGSSKLVCDTLISTIGTLFSSSTGKFITYFAKNNWWIYNVEKESHLCLTGGVGTTWAKFEHDLPGRPLPNYPPAWTKDDTHLILYDRYDIWTMKPDGTEKKRLTNGAKSNTVYRITDAAVPDSPNFYSYGFLTTAYNLKDKIVLKTLNEITLNEGFAVLYPNGKVAHLIEKASRLHLVAVTSQKNSFLVLEQNYSLPLRLVCFTIEGEEQELYQSNREHAAHSRGKSRLVYYTTSNTKHLKGALFYPANYDSNKVYPLLVSIYERKTYDVFTYMVPSLYNTDGFNVSNYVTDDYFVLYPDISYEVNFTGDSALKCVTAAVLKVLDEFPIDENNIGLIGHSFGGYEAAYIIGKTKLFKTAVLGAPVIDIRANYLTFDGHGISNMWRYEVQQMRITAPFYLPEFENNSPLQNIMHVTSPVLTWTGKKDLQVDWINSLKFHSALWRLRRESTLLTYENEGHVFATRENQSDLTQKIKNWFDYYLKNVSKPKWMVQ